MVDSYSSYRSCNNPSFSSTLLDAIYRSIDQGEEEVGIYGERIMREKRVYSSDGVGGGAANVRGVFRSEEEELANLQRACMIEKWMEKKVGGERSGAVRRKSAADLETKKSRKHRGNSSSSSSDSSCCGGGGGGSFFSETESFPVRRPKPIRTGNEKERLGGGGDYESSRRERRSYGGEEFERKPKHESGFLKTKSRALKIYGDLKKVKQPISPGGKLAGFLNSLFTGGGGGGNPKKSKVSTAEPPSLKSANASTCSSASSFSRSCLSKTPSSRGKSSNAGAKRSVRFSPVSVIVDEDCQPCGQKSLHNNKKQISNFDPAKNNNNNNINIIKNVINDEELMIHVMEKNRHVEQVARDLLRNYQRKSFDNLRKSHKETEIFDQNIVREDEDDDDDDAASCASSDLFELDNLSSIGMERYIEELPVYETTHFGANRAITNGLIL